MKKHIYLLLPLLTPTPSMAMWSWVFQQNQPTNTTKKIVTSTIIASTLVLSHYSYDKKRSLRLHQAVEQNNTTNVLQLITNPQVDINAKIDYGTDAWAKSWTPLIQCADRGDKSLNIAHALLKHQHIKVNLQNNKGWTPLIRCAGRGDKSLNIAHALLKHKHINVNLQDNYGWTPLIWCAFTGDDALPIAYDLIKHQHINVNLQDNLGRTPLIQCCRKGDKSLHIAQELLKHQHIKVNLQNNDGWTPLDKIIGQIQLYKRHNWTYYRYVQLWNLLVAQGAVLKKRKADYENLKPSDFKEPHRTYIDLIKQNLPKKLSSKKHHTPTQTHPNTYL